MKSYRDLILWQKSIEMVTLVYKLTKQLYSNSKFALNSITKQNFVSVSFHKVMGYGRNCIKNCVRFLNITRGSLYKRRAQLQVVQNLESMVVQDVAVITTLSIKV